MTSWFEFFKKGLARQPVEDRIGGGSGGDLRRNLANLRPFLARHWRKGLLGAGLILFTSLLGLPVPLITRYLIDDVILAKNLSLLLGVILVLVGVNLAGVVAGALQQFYFARFEREILLDIQEHLLDRTLRAPKSFFDEKETGYLMSRLVGDVGGLRFFFSSTVVHIVTSILRLVGGVALLFYLRWQLALVVLLALPLLVFLVSYFSRKTRVLSHHAMEQQAQVSRTLQESLASTTLIKSFAAEKRTVAGVVDRMREVMNLGLEQTTVGSAAGISIGMVPEIARVIVLLVGAYWVILGDWTLGSLLAFRSYVGYVYGPAQFLATTNLRFQGALAALERVSALFDIVPEEGGEPVERLQGAVTFDAVTFSYGGGEPVLQDLSLEVRPGDHVALVGPSGVGKTTLLSLILGFYRPQQGEIRFDGRSARDLDLTALRRRIGYVSQEPHLLSGTIRENLTYGAPAADRDRVERAARAAGIHDFIVSLAGGYEARVGERGVNLSVGQKQRLSIARALLKDPDIVILDEPTSALDGATEHSILSAMADLVGGKTLFVVAHRRATVERARRVVLLNERRVVAVGTHEELLEHNAYYRDLLAAGLQRPEPGGPSTKR